MSQLERLARPFPNSLIHSNPSGGGSYVKHSVVNEKLLAIVGPFDQKMVEIIRGPVPGIAPKSDAKSARGKSGMPALDNAIVGVVLRLTVDIDGRPTHIEEAGDCEDPHNWPHDGARLKDAMSDAFKRCAMRVGVTLHLWSGVEFSLYDYLRRASESAEAGEGSGLSRGSGESPVSAPTSGTDGSLAPSVPERVAVPAPVPVPGRAATPLLNPRRIAQNVTTRRASEVL